MAANSWTNAIDANANGRAVLNLQGVNDDLENEMALMYSVASKALDDVDSLKAENKNLKEFGLQLVTRLQNTRKDVEDAKEMAIEFKNGMDMHIENYKKLERINAMNYAEKKAYAQFARDTLNSSNRESVFEPMLYAGEKGERIRERIREVAGKVYDAGGSVSDGGKAAIREMNTHVRFSPLPAARREQIEDERWELIKNLVPREVFEASSGPDDLMAKCPEVNLP